MEILNFVDGQFSLAQNSDFFKYQSPFQDKPAINVANSGPLDLVKALQGSNKAFLAWKDSNLQDRLNLLEKISLYLEKNKIQFAEDEAYDQALNFDFTMKANIAVALKKLDALKAELKTQHNTSVFVSPVGVIGVILSWNLSTRLFVEKVIPAILAGNAVVVKVSSWSPVTGKLWANLFKAIELPAGLIQILQSQKDDFKKLMVSHPAIKGLVFTGSLENAGQVIKELASGSLQQFKKVQIFSGSKNSAIILNELDESQMQEVLDTFLRGQGQLNWNSARLFILEKNQTIWSEFIQDKINQLKPAESIFDPSVWTPLVKNKYLKIFTELENLARQDQAKLLTAQFVLKTEQSHFIKPFFTKDMSNCSTLQQDQVFGPAFVLSTVKYPFDIPKYSNVSYFGQSANIWTEPGKNQKVIDQLEVGEISLNKWSVYNTESIAGLKQSSYGNMDQHVFGTFYSNSKIIV